MSELIFLIVLVIVTILILLILDCEKEVDRLIFIKEWLIWKKINKLDINEFELVSYIQDTIYDFRIESMPNYTLSFWRNHCVLYKNKNGVRSVYSGGHPFNEESEKMSAKFKEIISTNYNKIRLETIKHEQFKQYHNK